MFKIGDEVFIKAEITDVHPGSERPYFVQPCYDSVNWVSKNTLYRSDGSYEQGLADAWELAKKIMFKEYGYSAQQIYDIFGDGAMQSLKKFTIEEALAKIEAYEKEKEIKVGDVVEDEEGTKALVIDEATENTCFVFTENGCVEDWYKMDLKKTGKHIDIEGTLKQIGE